MIKQLRQRALAGLILAGLAASTLSACASQSDVAISAGDWKVTEAELGEARDQLLQVIEASSNAAQRREELASDITQAVQNQRSAQQYGDQDAMDLADQELFDLATQSAQGLAMPDLGDVVFSLWMYGVLTEWFAQEGADTEPLDEATIYSQLGLPNEAVEQLPELSFTTRQALTAQLLLNQFQQGDLIEQLQAAVERYQHAVTVAPRFGVSEPRPWAVQEPLELPEQYIP